MADVDYILRKQVAELGQLAVRLDQNLGQVSLQVASVGTAQQETRNDLAQLRDELRAFVQRIELATNIQRAETKIGAILDEIEHQFGHHKVVRRTATGLLQAFDVGLVSDETVQSVSEQLMIQTPRYWLAPALVALAAWSVDDRNLCERAVEEAFRRSPEKTSLLFALVLRRQNRQPSAVRWLRHYLQVQNPASLGREFAVILEAVSQGAFGGNGRDLLRSTLDGWRELMAADEAAHDAQVRRWRVEVESYRAPAARANFPRLAAISPQWPQLEAGLRSAEAHRPLIGRYHELMSEEITRLNRLEDVVDDILDRLVSEYDTDELPLRRDLAYNQAVVASDGDTDTARRMADAGARALEERLDFLTVQSASALDPAAIGVSRATQKLSIAACSSWLATAHAGFARDYRAAQPPTVEVELAASHGFGSHAFGLPPWRGSLTTPMEHLEDSLVAHWDQHTRAFLDSMRYKLTDALIAPVIVTIVVFGIGVVINPVFGILAAAIVGGVWGLALYNRWRAGERSRENARQALQQAKQESLSQLRGAGAELVDYEARFRAADGTEAEARALIQSLSTAGHAGTPSQRRAVDV